MKRVFIIVLDGCGIGAQEDASIYGDVGANTILAVSHSDRFVVPNLQKLGLFQIDNVLVDQKHEWLSASIIPKAARCRMHEKSRGKDSTVGHWEMAGCITEHPFPTYPNGFSNELLSEFKRRTGRDILSNEHISGTEVIKKFGPEHERTGALIVYTAQDSVFQIAAHEDVVPIEELYRYCRIARELCVGENLVARVIARPFVGTWPNYVRTANRHDFTLPAPKDTILDVLMKRGFETIGIGKICDIFSQRGLNICVPTQDNADGIEKTIEFTQHDFEGLCFTNLVDFDTKYGHRNNVEGFADALAYFDHQLPRLVEHLTEEDVLILTADHGCDPTLPGADHSREFVPLLIYGRGIRPVNIQTRDTFADLGATILDMFGIGEGVDGVSFYDLLKKG